MRNYRVLCLCLVILIIGYKCQALKPSHTYAHIPSDFNMEYKEETVVTEDSAKLNVWYFENAENTERTMLICHNGEGNMGNYLDRVDQFLNLGYNVVTFDYRGYGKSSFFAIEPGVFIYPEFAKDVKAMIKYCSEGSIYPLLIYGWGAGASLALSVGYSDNRVDFILSDSPFLTTNGLAEKMTKAGKQIEIPPFFPKNLEPYYAVEGTPGKKLKGILLMVGDLEPIYGAKAMTELQSKKPKLIYVDVLPGAGFKNGFDVNSSYYFERIKDFMNHFEW